MRYITILTIAAASFSTSPASAGEDALLFPNSDFEQGDLSNWSPKDKAFDFQPVTGDGPNARRKDVSAQPCGTWWCGTYEKFQGKPEQKPGDTQGNTPEGEMLSTGFIIEKPVIGFLIAGGATAKTGAQLVVNGALVRDAHGLGDPAMRLVFWDVSEFKGEKAAINIYDHGSESWDFVSVDDFRAYDAIPDLRLFPNSDFEAGTLENWTAENAAFEGMPVKGDTVAKRGKKTDRSGHAGDFWIGTYEHPIEGGEKAMKSADRDKRTGTLRSIPFEIKYPAIGCLIGGGDKKGLAVRVLIEGKAVAEARGAQKECMTSVIWNLKEHIGKQAVIEIADGEAGAWGHINADDFRYVRMD